MSTSFTVSYAALWLLVAFQTVLLLGLTQSLHHARALGLDADERMRGRKAPRVKAEDLRGRYIDSELFAGVEHAFVFVGPNCASCNVTLDELGGLNDRLEGNLVVVCRGERTECRRLVEEFEIDVPVIADTQLEVSEAFQIRSVPTAVMIDALGTITRYGHPQRDDQVVEIHDHPTVGEFSDVADQLR